MLQTPEENARDEMRWANEAATQKKVRQFRSRLTRLKNKGDSQGIIALWEEFEAWCEGPEGLWPDNWSLWQRAADDAQDALSRG